MDKGHVAKLHYLSSIPMIPMAEDRAHFYKLSSDLHIHALACAHPYIHVHTHTHTQSDRYTHIMCV